MAGRGFCFHVSLFTDETEARSAVGGRASSLINSTGSKSNQSDTGPGGTPSTVEHKRTCLGTRFSPPSGEREAERGGALGSGSGIESCAILQFV